MKEYIEREAALAICEQEYQERLKQADWCGDTVAWNIGGAIKGLPAADVVEVVRCRECAHYKICDEWENGKRMLCEIHHHSYLDHDGDNHFCSWGQRKIETVLLKSDAKDESLEVDHEVS